MGCYSSFEKTVEVSGKNVFYKRQKSKMPQRFSNCELTAKCSGCENVIMFLMY